MFKLGDTIIVKGYCGVLIDFEVRFGGHEGSICNLVLRDTKDPRIEIVMEDIRTDELH